MADTPKKETEDNGIMNSNMAPITFNQLNTGPAQKAARVALNLPDSGDAKLIRDNRVHFITIDENDTFNISEPYITGKAKPGCTIIVEAGGATSATCTDADGCWSMVLPDRCLCSGGLYTLTATATDADGKIVTTSCRLDVGR